MKIYVVGHTDSVGEFDYNMGLSQRRAAAIVEVLVSQHGINQARLEPHGVGPLVPSSSNRSEDGRSMNRRVELVERLPAYLTGLFTLQHTQRIDRRRFQRWDNRSQQAY